MGADHERRVIIAVDTAKRPLDPLRLGHELARLLRAPLELLTVFPYLPVLGNPQATDMVEMREGAREDLLQLGADLRDVAVADAQVIASNTPARVLQEASERPDAGLLVIGSTTRGPLRRVLLGTVGGRLVEGGGCPLAIAPHGYGDAPSHDLRVVGAAYDGSDEARRALDAAQAIAARAGARLRVITVHQPMAFGAVPTSMLTPDVSVNRKLEDDARRVNDEAVAARQGELDVEGDLRRGNPWELLTQASEDVDLLVTGSRGYGPIGAVLLGSTTHELLRTAACPLLVTPRQTRLDVASHMTV